MAILCRLRLVTPVDTQFSPDTSDFSGPNWRWAGRAGKRAKDGEGFVGGREEGGGQWSV